ncbi:hypothetical protein MRX96_002763 [Rhipicephalus microplus]
MYTTLRTGREGRGGRWLGIRADVGSEVASRSSERPTARPGNRIKASQRALWPARANLDQAGRAAVAVQGCSPVAGVHFGVTRGPQVPRPPRRHPRGGRVPLRASLRTSCPSSNTGKAPGNEVFPRSRRKREVDAERGESLEIPVKVPAARKRERLVPAGPETGARLPRSGSPALGKALRAEVKVCETPANHPSRHDTAPFTSQLLPPLSLAPHPCALGDTPTVESGLVRCSLV